MRTYIHDETPCEEAWNGKVSIEPTGQGSKTPTLSLVYEPEDGPMREIALTLTEAARLRDYLNHHLAAS